MGCAPSKAFISYSEYLGRSHCKHNPVRSARHLNVHRTDRLSVPKSSKRSSGKTRDRSKSAPLSRVDSISPEPPVARDILAKIRRNSFWVRRWESIKRNEL